MEEDKCAVARENAEEKQQVIIINTDWTLEKADTRIYGMCSVDVSPPCSHLSFKRGFPLHTPTHARCGLFALILGLESVDRVWECFRDARVVITTKNKWIYTVLFDSRQVDRWYSTNKWPPNVTQLKNLFLRARDLAREYNGKVDVVGLDREEDEQCEVDLLDYSKSGGVDLDKVASKQSSPSSSSCKQRLEKEMFNMRMRSVMVDELLTSGARGHCRGKKKVSKTKRKKSQSKKTTDKTHEEKDTNGSATTTTTTTTTHPSS